MRYDLAIELVVPLPGFVKRRAEVRILNTVRELKTRAEVVTDVTGRTSASTSAAPRCLGVVLDDDGDVVDERRRPTPPGGVAILDAIAESSPSCARRTTTSPRRRRRRAGRAPRRAARRAEPVDVTERSTSAAGCSERLGCDVAVDNDATCAALAEWRLGAAIGVDDMVLVTLGTGIGGGLVAGGALQRGAHGFAGEFGHMVVDPDGPPCPCGRRGCWERYASGAGLALLAREAAVGRPARRGRRAAGGDRRAARRGRARRRARRRRRRRCAVIDEFARWVALGLVNLTNVLDPAMFVLGGGLAATAELYEPPIAHWFDELLYSPEVRPAPRLAFATWASRPRRSGRRSLGAG